MLRCRLDKAGQHDIEIAPRVDAVDRPDERIGKRCVIDGAHMAERRVKPLRPSRIRGAVIVLGKRIVTPSAPTFSAAAPCFCDRPGVRRQSGRATHIGKRRTVGGDDLPPAPARLWSAKQAGNCWKRVVRENVVPQLLEPCGPWQCPRRRPRATTGRALCVVVRRDERTRQPFVGRNDGGSCGERREQTGFEHSGDGLRGPSIRALPPKIGSDSTFHVRQRALRVRRSESRV